MQRNAVKIRVSNPEQEHNTREGNIDMDTVECYDVSGTNGSGLFVDY